MSENLVLVNGSCNARCRHCPYASDSATACLAGDPLSFVKNVRSDLVILSGGEPFEARIDVLFNYINACVSAGKYFRVATGGHLRLRPFLPHMKSTLRFAGIQLGTDVLLPERNANSLRHRTIWRENLSLLNDWNIGFGVTMTVDNDVEFEPVFDLLGDVRPDFFLTNTMNGGVEDLEKFRSSLKLRYPEVKIETGYTA